ncbi:HD domain-containing protein [Methylobacterium organophilum]|uniref:HD-GYP domain-containing protein n=1 Tax=Methylobacterium organophilum TaxID=410 RepID=UPI001F13B0AB|nr:HD domain-containing phosphohydrolase [Methylobacterium organophilum]UMY15870.1 HD domain-containing protein [Methylobacterium organophilum]
MLNRAVTVLTDRLDRSHELVEVAKMVADCRVVGLDVSWSQEHCAGVIADVTLSRPQTKSCLRALAASRRGKPPLPVIFLTRGNDQSLLREAQSLGATACMPAYSDPKSVVNALVHQISPGKTIADIIVTREVARTGSVMTALFKGAERGAVAMETVERGIDPVLTAIKEGGLARWLDDVWAHDDVTFQHCLLVSGLTATFACNLGLSKADQRLLTRAALVHDVGKSKIPLEILNKPGKLEDDERAVMQTHAPLGYDILAASGDCDPVTLAVARHHHELLDGSGYPDSLSGNAISDPIRLLTICDIYAALIERRPYKKPLSSTEAMHILESMRGKIEQSLVVAFGDAVVSHERLVA